MNKDFYLKTLKLWKYIMNTIYNIEVYDVDYIPTDSNFLLAGNHLHILDSVLVGSCMEDKQLRFMVDNKLYRYKSWEWFFKKLGTFPIDQNITDLNAVKTAIKLLKEYNNVVIFPEGKTHSIDDEVPFKNGVTRIAYMAGVPIIPFGINGTYKLNSDLSIKFGEPIDLSKIDKSMWDSELEKRVRILEKR